MRVGMAQMLVRGGDPEGNLRRAATYIQRAAREGCGVVVLPECLDWGWMHPGVFHRDVASLEALQQAAATSSVHVVAGFVERANGRFYNAAALISPLGDVLLRHRKLNELDLAKDLYSLGDSLGVAHTVLGRVGILICADLFPTTLVYADALAALGAQLILSPCAWAVEPNHDNDTEPYGDLWMRAYREITRKHPLSIVGVSNTGTIDAGPWKGHRCIGCSLAMGPGGRVLAQGRYEEEQLLVADVPLHPSARSYSPADPD